MNNTFIIKNKIMGQGVPKVCIPLMGATDEEILTEAEKILNTSKRTNIDMVEFRGDYYINLGDMNKLANILKKLQSMFSDIILLFTIRSYQEGGQKLSFDTPSVNDINTYVVEQGLSDMVDVELFSGDSYIAAIIDKASKTNVKIIMSNHDFKTTPDKATIVQRLRKMQELGADIAKIAVMPENRQHVIELQSALLEIQETGATVPLVGISMGQLGAISRIAAQTFGSAMTFATLGNASAPGQIPVEALNQTLGIIAQYTE